MAYIIAYTPEASNRYPQVKGKRKVNFGKWMGLALLLAAVLWMRLKGIPDFLIPGDAEVTKAAAAAMVDDLQDGISVNDAVTAFCRTILDGAGL